MADPVLNEFLEERWWAILIRGLCAIIFALIAFWQPAAAIAALMLLYGIYSIVGGVFALISSIGKARNGERWGWLAVEAVASIVIGVIILLWPALSVAAFLLILAVAAAVTGFLLIFSSIKLDGEHGQGWMLLAGLINLGFAAAIFLAPLMSAVVLTWWIAAWALMFGISLLILAFQLRKAKASA